MNVDKEKAFEIMNRNSLPVFLATCRNGQPVIRPMKAIVDENEMNVWLITYSGSKKVEDIEENSAVCLHFIDLADFSEEVTLYADACIRKDSAIKKEVWNMSNAENYFPEGPESEDFCVIEIKIRDLEIKKGKD